MGVLNSKGEEIFPCEYVYIAAIGDLVYASNAPKELIKK